MVDNQDSSRPKRRLGFKEIVPGQDSGAAEGKTPQAEVLQFDLGEHVTAGQRRVVASTRKGPGRKREPSPEPSAGMPAARDAGEDSQNRGRASDTDALQPTDAVQPRADEQPAVALQPSDGRLATDALPSEGPRPVRKARASDRVWCPPMAETERRVIGQIVARDIERLCRGERVFGS